jgi:hypothetical protein
LVFLIMAASCDVAACFFSALVVLFMTSQPVGAWRVPSANRLSGGLEFRSRFVHSGVTEETAMDAGQERQIIRLWNELRLLEREGRPTEAVRRQIERALAERESRAA